MAGAPYAPVGWGVVAADLTSIPVTYSNGNRAGAIDGSTPTPSAAAVPADVIKAFLQSHHTQSSGDALSSAASLEAAADDDGTSLGALRSTSSSHQQPLVNPFAAGSHHQQHQQQQHPPAAPDISTRMSQGKAGRGSSSKGLHAKPRKPLLKRLLRALMVTGASAGLLAAGAWGGMAAYRHYMAQLDDRDQLAHQVADLKRQEDKLVLRCTALEQDRSGLQQQVEQLAAAVAEGSSARTRLQQQLGHVQSERDEAIRLNLKLQGKLTSLEETHAGLTAAHRETQADLDKARAEANKLSKEAGQLSAAMEKLESRCAALESSQGELQRENSSLAAKLVQQRKAARAERADV